MMPFNDPTLIAIVKQQQSLRKAGKTKDRGQSVLCRCTSHL